MPDYIATSDYHYDLPAALIAQTPLADRLASRLLSVRGDGGFCHDSFKNITRYLNPGDCLVLNDSKVIPARLKGVAIKADGRGVAAEVLLLRPVIPSSADGMAAGFRRTSWEAAVRPGRHLRPGVRLDFGDGCLRGMIESILDNGNRLIEFTHMGDFTEILATVGEMPLPPYITAGLAEPARYQTVYANHDGSAAAPTAGLHFTPALLDEIRAKGVNVVFITLHVGLGTFRPVKVENAAEHHIHAEEYAISATAAACINESKAGGGRVVAVGTTVCRTIETAARLSAEGLLLPLAPCRGETDIFIYPGYRFKITDSLITNFHLPASTLLMLVAAFAGRETVMAAYGEAIREKYRFYSFGDAMFINRRR